MGDFLCFVLWQDDAVTFHRASTDVGRRKARRIVTNTSGYQFRRATRCTPGFQLQKRQSTMSRLTPLSGLTRAEAVMITTVCLPSRRAGTAMPSARARLRSGAQDAFRTSGALSRSCSVTPTTARLIYSKRWQIEGLESYVASDCTISDSVVGAQNRTSRATVRFRTRVVRTQKGCDGLPSHQHS